MVKKDEAFLSKLRETFAVEANEHLQSITHGLFELEKSPGAARRKEIVESIFRNAHNLKGAARAVNYTGIETLCQAMESVFSALKQDKLQFSSVLFDQLQRTVDVIDTMLTADKIAAPEHERHITEILVQQLEGLISGKDATGAKAAAAVMDSMGSDRIPAPETRVQTPGTIRITASKLDSLFRQAEEMISAKQAVEQHGNILHGINGVLEAHVKNIDKPRGYLTLLQSLAERSPQALPGGLAEFNRFLSILEQQRSTARQLTEKIRELTAAVAADRRTLVKMIDNLQDTAKELLMQPLNATFDILPRIVRDIAHEQGKEVDIIIQGGEVELDRRIQEEMKDPLIHLVRNCVDHGIEPPVQRLGRNKPARGRININVAQQGTGKVVIEIADDGQGIDRGQVLKAAQKLAFISSEDSGNADQQLINSLIFRSGLSTSPIVTDISGRGLGLAIVREKTERLGGTVMLETEPGVKSVFRITLPVMLAAFHGVIVRAAGHTFVLPAMNVERVMRVPRENIKTVENRAVIQVNGHSLSLARLADVLGLPRGNHPEPDAKFLSVVVLNSGGDSIAFGVEEVLHEQEILLKDLGSRLKHVRHFTGSSPLGSGRLVPFLNAADLMQTAMEASANRVPALADEGAEPRIKSILVVEDSITARSLLKNILEAAGYQVQTAVDGIDAMTSLKTGSFDLVVSDVEMPRMDGFDLTEKIRADNKLKDIPVILVTALASREHRERGIDAGANAYIVKSNFDQSGLIEIVRRYL
jgi:two-component system chemotaxis sensor kinase CheA